MQVSIYHVRQRKKRGPSGVALPRTTECRKKEDVVPRYRDSSWNFIAVRSSSSMDIFAKAGMHTRSMPFGATYPLAMAMDFTV